MKMRIIGALAVLSLSVVGIALAQEPKAADKPALRNQVIKLRVEIDLLELDHAADREHLLTWMKSERMGSDGLAGLALETMLSMTGNPEALKIIKDGEALVAKAKEKGEDEDAVGRRILAEAVKKQINPLRKNYARQAAELAEKRLELEAVEKQYQKAE